jgi:3-oxoacyl-[acyl-carrier protein] reductase
VAIVTGASRGIGLAAAERIVAEGGSVTITARKPEGLQQAEAHLIAVAEQAGAAGARRVLTVAGRADDEEHRSATFAATVEAFGGLDVLVNNTGINPTVGLLAETPRDMAEKTFAVNVLAALEWVKAAQDAGLGSRPGAAIVNVASIAGVTTSYPIGFYGLTKAALIHATAELGVELAPAVRVNAVAPAVVKTVFASALYEGREADVARQYPLARLGVPADIAAAIAFLASDDAAWITGQTLVIDGGISLRGAM